MISGWTKNLRTEEEKLRFQSSVIGAKPVLDRLNDLLTEAEQQLDKGLMKESSYDSPNWALKAADRNGFIRAISTIKQLINLDQQKAN